MLFSFMEMMKWTLDLMPRKKLLCLMANYFGRQRMQFGSWYLPRLCFLYLGFCEALLIYGF